MEELVNEKITAKEVLLICDDEQLGVRTLLDALYMAKSKNLDLVCVAPGANPPVCKIMNYGKYKYEKEKKAKLAKKNQHNVETSEVQITSQIQDHDLETKMNTIKRLIDKGDEVQLVLRLRGREVNFKDLAEEKFDKLVSMCSDFAKIKKAKVLDGRDIRALLEKK